MFMYLKIEKDLPAARGKPQLFFKCKLGKIQNLLINKYGTRNMSTIYTMEIKTYSQAKGQRSYNF